MRKQRPIFAFFAAAILFLMVREWSAPSACESQSTGHINSARFSELSEFLA
jgi:hypothetical protein